MPDAAPPNLDHLFIVRVWREAAGTVAWPWRGSVEHVPSGQRLHFSALADLNDFITWRLDSSTPKAIEDRIED
jgi:hypothetical protein